MGAPETVRSVNSRGLTQFGTGLKRGQGVAKEGATIVNCEISDDNDGQKEQPRPETLSCVRVSNDSAIYTLPIICLKC